MEFVDFLKWQTHQKIFLHMVTAQSFYITASKDTIFFTFASLEFTLQFDKNSNEYFIILPENFLYFYQINGSNTECFSIMEDKTTLMYVIPHEEFTLLPNPPKKPKLEKGATI